MNPISIGDPAFLAAHRRCVAHGVPSGLLSADDHRISDVSM